ncbi:hypothetical protein PI95_034100 [Hassallia byssoidea VB512170]|uniref:Uncharacterized protein n=1 Tax=Hassallia byssoidea VB512170 TaxID=1304833 RepID=A0A846HNA8_9CYAN|nr:hypothetical protein [Hassalia byssoidea]NEU77370.1 hypothetical protein [Hassalia byssoidea VB512170]
MIFDEDRSTIRVFQADCKPFSYEARSPVVVLRRNGYSSITSAGND